MFQKLDSGFALGGNDTVLWIPKSDSGRVGYQIAFVVTDEDGETTVKRSQTFRRDSIAVTVHSASESTPAIDDAMERVGKADSKRLAIEPVAGGSELPAAKKVEGTDVEVALVSAPGARRAVSLDTGAVRSPRSTPT